MKGLKEGFLIDEKHGLPEHRKRYIKCSIRPLVMDHWNMQLHHWWLPESMFTVFNSYYKMDVKSACKPLRCVDTNIANVAASADPIGISLERYLACSGKMLRIFCVVWKLNLRFCVMYD